MRKNLFVKYFSICAAIILISITFLGMMLLLFSARYFGNEKQKTLSTLLDEAAALSERTYNAESNTFENGTTLRAGYTIMAGASDAVVFLCDANGKVLLCSEEPPCIHTGATVSQSVMKQAWGGRVAEQGTLGGLYKDRYYTVSQTLKTDDGLVYGVLFASSSADTLTSYLQDVFTMFLVSAAAVLVFAFVVIYFVTLDMVRPLRQMSAAVKGFAKGDFSARIEATGTDEVSELSTAINNMAAGLSELETTRRSFTANVSHELKTPMTIIGGFVDGILDGTIDKEHERHYLTIVSGEVKRLSRLVTSMLAISRMEAGELTLTLQRVDITTLLARTVFSFEKRIEEKKLSVEGLDMEKCYVKADPDLIHQVVYNLVDNAVKFANVGGAISFSIRTDAGRAYISVRNTGDGIVKEEISRVFDRFYKTDRSRSMNKEGVGLGLYIVKNVVNMHGGEIIVKSQKGEYCEFVFSLETAKQDRKEKKLESSETKARGEGKEHGADE